MYSRSDIPPTEVSLLKTTFTIAGSASLLSVLCLAGSLAAQDITQATDRAQPALAALTLFPELIGSTSSGTRPSTYSLSSSSQTMFAAPKGFTLPDRDALPDAPMPEGMTVPPDRLSSKDGANSAQATFYPDAHQRLRNYLAGAFGPGAFIAAGISSLSIRHTA